MRLAELRERGHGREVWGDADVEVSGVRHDSREVEAGDLFVAIPGLTTDGARFARAAIEAGAVALAVEARLDDVAVPQLHVDDARAALGPLAAAVYGNPFADLDVVGITGTNGKTTTAWLVEQALVALGERPALLGTIESRGPGIHEPAPFTTPEGDALARFARTVGDAGATHLVMEVSSHALAMRRAEAVHFRVGAFTNLSQDHLDFHASMDAYFEAKARLFLDLAPRASVIHVGDPKGQELASRLADHPGLLRVAVAPSDADLVAEDPRSSRAGTSATLVEGSSRASLTSPLLGEHNLENLLVAAGILRALGVPLDDATRALGQATGAPGRFERIEGLDDVLVLVDYAHTPDALARALAALRPVTPGRVIAVFGCGGDRDREKRALMGAAVGDGADSCVITSDNPRTEDPMAILAAIEPAVAARMPKDEALDRGYRVVEDRAAAIDAAIGAARPGDTVLVAGKGHEDYQIRGTERVDFDDRVACRASIARRGEG